MSFTIDKQTQQDLNLFNQKGKKSVYNLFNKTRTKGGALLLEDIFRYPCNDHVVINHRVRVIKFVSSISDGFPFDLEDIDAAEQYLLNTDRRSQLFEQQEPAGKFFKSLLGSDIEQKIIFRGIDAVTNIISALVKFFIAIIDEDVKLLLYPDTTGFSRWTNLPEPGKLTQQDYIKLDKQFRFEYSDEIRKVFNAVYQLDVYLAAAGVAKSLNMNYPLAMPSEKRRLLITSMYHPLVDNAVANNVFTDHNSNVLFLTGANMAGKSTYMKSFGIAVFLAHIGFPVPAVYMEFSVLDGIYTTINLPDNMRNGYSHFYAEVMRVKMVAEQLRLGKNLLIIFDELFRGTNVKDAYDATVAITGALAQKSNCTFLVSTHIMEAGEKLRQMHPNILFLFLPTILDGNKPTYTYQVKNGISNDRQGMMIIRNEGILEILKSRKHHSEKP